MSPAALALTITLPTIAISTLILAIPLSPRRSRTASTAMLPARALRATARTIAITTSLITWCRRRNQISSLSVERRLAWRRRRNNGCARCRNRCLSSGHSAATLTMTRLVWIEDLVDAAEHAGFLGSTATSCAFLRGGWPRRDTAVVAAWPAGTGLYASQSRWCRCCQRRD